MKQIGRHFFWACLAWSLGTAVCLRATEVVLNDGRVLHGKLGKTAGLVDVNLLKQSDSTTSLKLIDFLDDSLRRTYFSHRLAREVHLEENRTLEEKFKLHQPVARNGATPKTVGPAMAIQPFDEYGRRMYTLNTERGPVKLIQGITELTPQWCKVEAKTVVWDMRLATSCIPRDELRKILWKQADTKNPEAYKKIARFYLQGEHYEEARQALEAMLAALPDRPDLKEQLAPTLRRIVEASAQQLLSELRLRREAGQHKLVSEKLKKFPAEGVSSEMLQGVRQLSQEYDVLEARRENVDKQLKALSAKLKDSELRERVQPILGELADELSLNTLERMAPFLQNANDKDAADSAKVSWAVSGWLMGATAATARLDTTTSMYRVRGLIRQYLTEANARARETTCKAILQEYAGDPTTVAALVAHMKPPLPAPQAVEGKPGYYVLKTPGLADAPEVTYYVQLPPEYDPYRRYPAIVTLHGELSTAEQQIDWWAGPWKDGQRAGQAARHGSIVIAPVWTAERQNQYRYSARELAAVLNSLRDAYRRFSIDTDRVYLSGHWSGGDAAWDIGLAHPDLWAGVIPIAAQPDRYCEFYKDNARYVPFYVVVGELDGDRLRKIAKTLDPCLRYGYNTTVVEFIGRGHDDFSDEILRIFDWMAHFRRNFFPREFLCKSMRPWDNSFWWVEMQGMPPKCMVDPANWPPPSGSRPVEVKSSLTNKNGLIVGVGSTHVTVWLSPEMLDFKQRATIMVNGKRLTSADQIVRPSLKTLLEDVRTRGDRQHPFWAKLEGATGRVHPE
jgi:tetratricopeptide (TPR) repeat protein